MKKEIVSDAAFKASTFSCDFNFALKDGQVSAETCKYYCPLFVNPTITNYYKEFILNMAEFWDRFLKISPCMKTSLILCENQSFFLLFRNVATFIESHCVFLCYFLQYDEVFLISLLVVCYHNLSFMDQSMVVQSQTYL